MAAKVQGQSYTPFDFKHGEWVCGYDTKGGVFGYYGTYYIKEEVKFYCQGDTIINDTLFNKLYYRGVTRYPEWARRELSGYYGPIRNDTINRQVWLGGFLLYDFNIKVGDTVLFTCGSDETVISIDSVEYCDTYRRRYNAKNVFGDNLYLIEGVGSIFGLIPHGCMPSISWLDCYSEANNLICDTCKTPVSVNEVAMENIEIFPNPTNDHIRVTSSIPVSSVEILDLLGRRVFYDSHGDKSEIEIQIRERGVYFVRVGIQGKTVVRKILRN
ncbi:MAG: T9SS type A sorting domain-containing protein [Bacteroidales bacterium]